MPETDIPLLMAGTCILARTRLLSRAVTHLYDTAIRPHGIQGSQLNLLTAIAVTGPVRRRDLGQAMHFDSSTLTRNLRVMLQAGWIEDTTDPEHRRGRRLVVTPAGRSLIAAVAPAWRDAQLKAAALLGADTTAALVRAANGLMHA